MNFESFVIHKKLKIYDKMLTGTAALKNASN